MHFEIVKIIETLINSQIEFSNEETENLNIIIQKIESKQ